MLPANDCGQHTCGIMNYEQRHKDVALKVRSRSFLIVAAVGTIAGVVLSFDTTKLKSVPIATMQDQFIIHSADPSDIRYVAVGDSYSIGTGTTPEKAWPSVITKDLRAKGIKLALVANLGVNGWTTDDALTREMPAYQKAAPQFATLMIGVNDTYRGTTPDEFRAKFVLLADRMRKALPTDGRIVAVTIPDFTVTHAGKAYSSRNNAKQKIGLFNTIIKDESGKRGIPVVDVFTLSKRMENDPTLVAEDGLHPSAKGYALWGKQIEPVVYSLLKKATTNLGS